MTTKQKIEALDDLIEDAREAIKDYQMVGLTQMVAETKLCIDQAKEQLAELM